MWMGQSDVFSEPIYAPTLYPLGDSMDAWAKNVLDASGDTQLIVVGCSMGGSCALEMARQAGERIAALVLVGAKACHDPEPELRDTYITALQKGGMTSIWPELADQCFGVSATTAVIRAAKTIAMEQDVENLVLATKVFRQIPPRLVAGVGKHRRAEFK